MNDSMEQQEGTQRKRKRKGEFGRSATNPVLTRSRQEAYWYLELLQKGENVKVVQQPDTQDGLLHFKVYREGRKRERNLYFNCHSSVTSAKWPDGFCFKSCFREYLGGTDGNRALAERIAAQKTSCRPEDTARFDFVKELAAAGVRLLRWKEVCTYAEGEMRTRLEMLANGLYERDCQMVALYTLAQGTLKGAVSWREWTVKFRKYYSMLEPVREANNDCYHNVDMPEQLKVFVNEILDEYINAEM